MMWWRALIDWAVCLVCFSLLSNHNDNISTRRSVLIIYHSFSLKHHHELICLLCFFFLSSFFLPFWHFSHLLPSSNSAKPCSSLCRWRGLEHSDQFWKFRCSHRFKENLRVFAEKNRRETFVKDLFLRTINAIGVARNHLKFSVLCKAKEIIRYNIE